MPSRWGEEFSEWMRLGEQMLGGSVDSVAEMSGSFAELTRRAMRPWADVLDQATARLIGREVEYQAGGVTGRATIESFVVVGDPSRMASDIDATLSEPRWGDHSAESLVVRASGVHLFPGAIPEARAERVELTATFPFATVARWFDGAGSLRLVSFDAGGLRVVWRRRRLKLTIDGTASAAGDRLHLIARRVVLWGKAIELPTSPEVTLAVPLSLPSGLLLTGAAVEEGRLVVRAVAHNVGEPVRPDRVLKALDGSGAVRLYRPARGPGLR